MVEKKQLVPHGAIPPPEVFTKYPTVIGEKIIQMALSQMEHRQRSELFRLQTERLGVVCGFLVAVSGVIASVYFASIGHPWPGAAVGAVDIVGLVSVFIYGTRANRQARQPLRLQKATERVLPTQKATERVLPPKSSERH